MTTHLSFDAISAVAEQDALPREVAAHLERCAECRATLERVRALLAAARALPSDLEPPEHAWTGLRDRLARERRTALSRRWWNNPWIAAAALLIAVGVASLVAGRRRVTAPESAAAGPRPAAVPVVQSVDRTYAGTIAELRASLASQRQELAPATVRTVDRALTVIDSAIAEARAALAADPANAALVEILSAHYERKVDLLQRAAELSSL